MGDACWGLGEQADALAAFARSFPLQRGDTPVAGMLAAVHLGAGRPAAAARIGRRGLALSPGEAACWMAVCHGASLLGRAGEALVSSARALAIAAGEPAYQHVQARLLLSLGRPDAALQRLAAAHALAPADPLVLKDLSGVLLSLGAYVPAGAGLRRALALTAADADVLANLGALSAAEGRRDAAARQYARAVAVNPDHAEARWKAAVVAAPFVPAEPDPFGFRQVFQHQLDVLERLAGIRPDAHEIVGRCSSFSLAYVEDNNSDLLGRHGALCARLMAGWQAAQGIAAARPLRTGPLRVGIASAHMRVHSVWQALVKGWFRHLDRDRFALHGFHLGMQRDGETEWAEARSAVFVHGPKDLRQWAEAIAGSALDVLIYPEIGMDPLTVKLASLRLAPRQMASWGHPETTGLPTIDGYLTAEDLEPADAAAAYAETLIRLPRLGCCYAAFDVRPAAPDLAALGLGRDLPTLLCPGAPLKYGPRSDRVLADIATRVGPSQFVFFASPRDPAPSAALEGRVRDAFRRRGLDDGAHIRFVPWQPLDVFYGLMRAADVFLDTIGFSGFNTAMQAVECGLPIVAFEGRFLRGRLASGIMKRIGLGELVAGDDDAYAAVAARLLREPSWRQDVRRRMRAAAPALVDDVGVVRALERVLLEGARA
jgi:predicted O-linked N-acetylglucosamine transferase (SPINDLY family)